MLRTAANSNPSSNEMSKMTSGSAASSAVMVQSRPAASRCPPTAGRNSRGSTLHPMAQAPALPRGFELAVEQRAAELAKRSIKKDAKVWALELALRCCDLTTLEGQDTPGKVSALCSKAIRPDPSDPGVPSVAAVCVYPNLVPVAVERLA